ncbi:very short patch repair endonuclease [Streptococcus oralis]|uniref:Very short patch repair endonuclease n=1 Tax=Streptococcus oralis TaxID=1303 RepID=A0A1L8Q323_STROR|nr:very short patch repair endonuclease [Streptococcus oralis]OJG01914.1 very short patch repair endonuclease [Streptococcus oralis]
MHAIKSKNFKIELTLRKELWSRGLRYQKNVKTVFGRPDIVFKGKKVTVFYDGEFWHGYDWEHKKNNIQSRRDYWIPKIERNMARAKEVTAKLESEGWTVLRFWGKEIKDDVEKCGDRIELVLGVIRPN